MKAAPKDFSVDPGPSPDTWLMRGILRLESPEAYAKAFAPIVASLSGSQAVSIDLSQVVFLNSSGIRGLADVLVAARDNHCRVTLLGSGAVPWQRKLATSLTSVFPELEMRIDR